MMKYPSRLLGMCAVLAALAFGSILSGCKDTAPDPTYVDFASIRVMHFVQCGSIQFVAYPTNNISDTVLSTPTPVTYGVSTPYVNNLPTGRGAGQQYHLVAFLAGTKTVIAQNDITLMPGDKWTWVLFQPDANGNYDPLKPFRDLPVANASNAIAYFRFMNVSPDADGHNPMHLMVGDPVNGMEIGPSGGTGFAKYTDYAGIPTAFDTTVTFFVTDANHQILGRLAGVSLSGGSYHTIAWGGQQNNDCRTVDFNGHHIPDDSIRVHMFDDNEAGNDALPVPVTMRYNIVNALLPPSYGARLNFPDYTASGGLGVVINNNTAYDYNHVMPYTPLPYSGMESTDPANPVYMSIPKAIPYTGLAYIKLVKPMGANPSFADTILFRFYGSTQRVITDQLVSFIVFDTVQSSKAEANPTTSYFDSAKGVYTMQVPDQSDPNSATVVFANLISGYKSTAAQMKGDFNIGGSAVNAMQPKPTAPAIITGLTGSVTISGTLNAGADPALPTFTFNAQPGAIYEVVLVGERNRPDGDQKYVPHFMVIRTNPIMK